MEQFATPFTIGHHDRGRPLPITAEAVASAHASGYDILTSPITTDYFHSRVLASLSDLPTNSTLPFDDVTKSLNASPVLISPLAPADTVTTPDDTTSHIIGITASWIDLASPDPVIADISRQVLQLELAYAAFCGMSYVIVHGPRISGNGAGSSEIAQYARAILDALAQGPFMTVYIWLSMIDHPENLKVQMGDLATLARPQNLDEGYLDSKGLDLFGTWQAWDIIRSICRYSTRLCIALSVPKLLPPTAIQSRWFSEPIRILTLAADTFVKNPKGYPVLSKAHQALISRFVHAKQPATWFLLCNVGLVPTSSRSQFSPSDPDAFPSLAQANNATPQLKDQTPHLSYMRNLQAKGPQASAVDAFGAGYQDYLQAPLQPLTVNLESITYEVFEKDPIKYEWYERAIARALDDWIEQGKPTSNPDGRVVVAVVGAGRGPLVTRALQASEATGVEIDMWALEKNPNAFVLLQRHNETTWGRKVNLVKSDMRTWRGPVRQANAGQIRKSYNLDPDDDAEAIDELENNSANRPSYTGSTDVDATYLLATATHTPTPYKIDILISELLGSFADNELSPECLDGVQHLLNPTHGISIPSSYTAHITPIAAPKLHADISLTMTNTNLNAAEVPYVVMFNAIDFLSTSASPPPPPTTIQDTTPLPQPPQPIIETTWSFQHPNPLLPSLTTTSLNPTTTLNSSASNAHNARVSSHTFPITHRATCHGIAGYFETVLYAGVELSTNPNTMAAKSEDMISWFPIFFPFKTPLHLPDNSHLSVTMWRRTDDRKVWYEWIADVFISLPSTTSSSSAGTNTATATGKQPRQRRVRIGGTELHSSEKEGCLM